jgi:prepilin-type N-terminal cleavage/methylation domain-containing protein
MDMHRHHPSRAFTIIELLVVVSIIALLVGILLPAIGKARDNAQLTRSQANMKNMGTACANYGAEYKDRQITWINDNFAHYGTGAGTDLGTAFNNYATAVGAAHPWHLIGAAQGPATWYFLPNGNGGRFYIPIDWSTKVGAFRTPNTRSFNQYLNGRFYDPIFYAPKDTAVWASVENVFDYADEFTDLGGGIIKYSSYCFSPAAMFSPDVFSYNKNTGKCYTDPWDLPGGFRSPSPSQARFSDLKSNMTEHHWLQNRRKSCITQLTGGVYDGCQPPFFNGSLNSSPVTLFFDGHIGQVGQREAIDACARVATQSGGTNRGTWSIDTPLKGAYTDYSDDGYYMEYCTDWSATSWHILTVDGIKGRDILGH